MSEVPLVAAGATAAAATAAAAPPPPIAQMGLVAEAMRIVVVGIALVVFSHR